MICTIISQVRDFIFVTKAKTLRSPNNSTSVYTLCDENNQSDGFVVLLHLSNLATLPSVWPQRSTYYQSVPSPRKIAISDHAQIIVLLVALRNSALSQKLEK